jgi:iron complex outermembrane recepter protein
MRVGSSVRVWLAIALSGSATLAVSAEQRVVWALPGTAQEKVLDLANRDRPAKTVKEWMAQVEAAIVRVTGVRVDRTDQGLQVVLETEAGRTLQATQQADGETLILTVPNAVLALSSGQSFEAEKPGEGINRVSVTQADATSIRISIVGIDDLPTAEVVAGQGLVLAVTPEAAEEEEITVTGEGQRGYRVPNTSTATRTDTPIRDVPASIQVVPQEVIRDRNVRNVTEALETVSGVANSSAASSGAPVTAKIIRGFDQTFTGVTNFRNGIPDADFFVLSPIGTVEQVEVLKGPASVLFGAGEPGGIVNVVTKKPLNEAFYQLAFEAGNYGLYQPSLDFSGPLNSEKTALYRFIASYRGSGDFQGFADTRLTTIAPSIALKLGNRTDLNLYYEYVNLFGDPATSESNSALLSDGRLIPRDFANYYPSLTKVDTTTQRLGYSLSHTFNDNLQLRNNIAVNLTRFAQDIAVPTSLVDDRFLDGFFVDKSVFTRGNYFGQIEILGKFKTGAISHQLLAGFDFNLNKNRGDRRQADTPPPALDIQNPNYDVLTPTYSTAPYPFSNFDFSRRFYGIYLQDQIKFSDNLKLLIGGRYDWISTDLKGNLLAAEEIVTLPTRNDSAFSPRVGLVYQPNKDVSLYASYTRSFFPLSGFDNLNLDPNASFQPSRGTQYEVGVKTDLLGGRLSTTLAVYQLTKTNVLTPDPTNPLRSIQTGEQRSRGVELDVAGEILPGWKVTAAYSYTNAEVTKDNTFAVGNRLANVPENQVSLWTTYEIQKGGLKGLGFGLGLFYIGERQGSLDNSFTLKDYLRTDAALYYRRDGFKAAINVRNLFDIDAAAFSGGGTAFIQRVDPLRITGSISFDF